MCPDQFYWRCQLKKINIQNANHNEFEPKNCDLSFINIKEIISTTFLYNINLEYINSTFG